MKKFLFKIFLLVCFLLILVIACLVLPPNNLTRNSLLFAQTDKNQLLENTPSPRILFVGGSNLSFGLNSQMVKDSLGMNPVNTGIHAGLGLKYMLMNMMRYIRENDIIVVSPEYQQFYGDLYNGGPELLITAVDAAPGACDIDFEQRMNMAQNFPSYSSTKLKWWNDVRTADTSSPGLYDRKSFNALGDTYVHWALPGQKVPPQEPLKGRLNEEAIALLIRCREMALGKKAMFYITFPCYQDLSFNRSVSAIKAIEEKLRENNFILLGSPERYRMPDSLIFNTAYHLIKRGVDYRTNLLIEDIRKAMRTGR